MGYFGSGENFVKKFTVNVDKMSTSYLRKQNMIEQTLIDDCFYIKKQRWGTFVSMHKSGRELLTSLSEGQCVKATRWYLKAEQDGFPDSSKSYDSVVGGKL